MSLPIPVPALLGAARLPSALTAQGASLLSNLLHAPVPLGVYPTAIVVAVYIYYVLRLDRAPKPLAPELAPLRPIQFGPASTAPPAAGVPSRGARVWRSNGEVQTAEGWTVASVSAPFRRLALFDRNLVLSFVLLVVAAMLIRHPAFYLLDQIVRAAGDAVYWPRPWPTLVANVPIGTPVPDYILLMYLALTGAFLLAAGVPTNPEYTPAQRQRIIRLLLVYLAAEVLVDVTAFTVSDPFALSAFLLVRGILGGMFFTTILFTVLVLPPPTAIVPLFPRDRGATTVFVLSWVAALAAAATFLYLLYRDFRFGQTELSFGVLLLLPLLTFMAWVAIGRVLYVREIRVRPPRPLSEFHPKVSLLIPAYNEQLTIASAIRSADLAARRYPGEVEILIGNDGSTDRTSAVARAAIAKLQHATGAVLDLPHGGKSNALNGMLRLAQGEIVVRMDADARVSPTVGFERMVGHLGVPDVGGVQGTILPLQEEGWTRRLRFMEICWSHLFLRRAQMATRTAQVVDGAFCAFRRSDLLKVGGWVPWNGEDTEITLRLQRMGYRMRFETRALAYEDVPDNYDRLERQRIRWSRGSLFAHHRHLGALRSHAREFGGLAMVYWLAFFLRNGLRSLIYFYVVAVALFLPTLAHLVVIIAILFLARSVVLVYYLWRIGRWRFIPWVVTWPATSAMKQHIAMKSWGTMLPGSIPEFSE